MVISQLPDELGRCSSYCFVDLDFGYHLDEIASTPGGHVGPDLRSRDFGTENSRFYPNGNSYFSAFE